ncbi:MAG TPA: hypothetical protein VNX26_07095 [Candidatus Acidoferrum sp.]|jgi:hypothetical protein|nr:hypothetical protein [Candidatus Acidoferrum sp.]
MPTTLQYIDAALHSIQMITSLLTMLGLLAVVVVFVWFNHELFPVLYLKIEMAESKEMPGTIHIRLAAENRSKVHIKLNRSQGSWLQILSYETSQMETLPTFSEWVPFSEDRMEKDGPQPRNGFPKPRQVMKTTEYIEPGESIRIELLHRPLPSRQGIAVACGFQVHTMRLKDELEQSGHPVLAAMAKKLDELTHNPTDRFTTTAWLLMSPPIGSTTSS